MIKVQSSYTVEENLTRLRELMSPYLNNLDLSDPRIRKKKFRELNETAIFLIHYSHDWSISEMREEPDFIIKNGRLSIGLEHTNILNEKLKSKGGVIEELFVRAEKLLRLECKDLKFFATIYVNKDYSLKKNQKGSIVREICEVVKSYVQGGVFLESGIIKRISITPSDKIWLYPHLGAWWQTVLTKEKIVKAIEGKEKSIQVYKDNTKLKQWLILVSGGTDETTYTLFNEFELDVESKFEKIFLMELSSLRLFEINKVLQNQSLCTIQDNKEYKFILCNY